MKYYDQFTINFAAGYFALWKYIHFCTFLCYLLKKCFSDNKIKS